MGGCTHTIAPVCRYPCFQYVVSEPILIVHLSVLRSANQMPTVIVE